MCKHCDEISKMCAVKTSGVHDATEKYDRVLSAILASNKIELYAGDSPAEEIELHLKNGDYFYSFCHFFKCRCGKIFFIGVCDYGHPKCEEQTGEELPRLIEIMTKGRYGSYYSK